MANTNIKQFDEITGKIFAQLYEQFPVPTTLKSSEFVENPTIYHTGMEMDVASKDSVFFCATVSWLADSGYVKFGKMYADQFVEAAVLTAKALEVLKATPDSLSSTSIGEQLQEAAKGGMLDAVQGLANQALSRAAGMAIQAGASWASTL